jgi:O-methyltransferase
MEPVVYKELLEEALEASRACGPGGLVILGEPDICDELAADLRARGSTTSMGPVVKWDRGQVTATDRSILDASCIEVVVIASDRDKEMMVRALPSLISGMPRVLLAGYGHFEFQDEAYASIVRSLAEPSLANGYPHSRIHLYQCLQNATRLGLDGVIVEFGMFRGGTTQFLAEATRSLGAHYPIIGFDSFDGFPPAKHLFDMYSHPDLSHISLLEVQHRLSDYDIEIVPGDIVITADEALLAKSVVLAFIDTDNYSSGRAAIESVIDRTVIGGSIVFDHFTGVDRFKRTLGERLAAQDVLVDDPRYFNLHGTGVFLRRG